MVSDFAWKNRGLLICCLLPLLLLCSCTGRQALQPAVAVGTDDQGCRQFWQAMERTIGEAEVSDAASQRVAAYPYLRGNRFLQALADQAAEGRQRAFVLEEMRRFDLERRQFEVARLPVADRPDSQLLHRCSRQLLAVDGARPGFFDQVRQGLDLDRDYSLWLRTVGLYPLTSLVVNSVAANAQKEVVARLHAPRKVKKNHVTFRPLPAGTDAVDVAGLLAANRRPPFLTYDLRNPDLQMLVERFAPLVTVDAAAAYDRFGEVVYDGEGFAVDEKTPVVYYYLSHTFVQGHPALQLNYVIWFAERAEPAAWFEQGELDGLIFRVTLTGKGEPLFLDVAFACGCYHFVMFADNLVGGAKSTGVDFQPVVAGRLPVMADDQRLHFQLMSGWHQVVHVGAATAGAGQPAYRLRPYEELEHMEQNGMAISLFNSKGWVPGTVRPERFFLFPMGIPKVGALRQRGRQPITLVGRAYLDDPYLFDNAFTYGHRLESQPLETEAAEHTNLDGRQEPAKKPENDK